MTSALRKVNSVSIRRYSFLRCYEPFVDERVRLHQSDLTSVKVALLVADDNYLDTAMKNLLKLVLLPL